MSSEIQNTNDAASTSLKRKDLPLAIEYGSDTLNTKQRRRLISKTPRSSDIQKNLSPLFKTES